MTRLDWGRSREHRSEGCPIAGPDGGKWLLPTGCIYLEGVIYTLHDTTDSGVCLAPMLYKEI